MYSVTMEMTTEGEDVLLLAKALARYIGQRDIIEMYGIGLTGCGK